LPVGQNPHDFVDLVRPGPLKRVRNHVRAKIYFREWIQVDLGSPALTRKYLTSVFQKFMIVFAYPASARGTYRDRHGRWKRGAVDAAALPDEQG
jgi:hypothetical protein